MRRINSKIETAFITEKGSGNFGRTYFAYVPLEHMACYAVAESYDNDADLNSAKLAVEAALSAFEQKPSFGNLKKYIRYAHEQIVENSVKNRLEVSITVVVTDYTRYRYASCGNVKFFLLKDNSIYERSEPQVYYESQTGQEGLVGVRVAEVKNLTQYLGMKGRPKPFVSKKMALPEGGTMLLATGGIWEKLSDIEILDTYDSDSFLDNLQELYLQTQLHTQLNEPLKSYTLATIFIEKKFKEDGTKQKKCRRILILLLCVILIAALIITIVILTIRARDKNALTALKKLDDEAVRYSQRGDYQLAFEQYQSAEQEASRLGRKSWNFIEAETGFFDDIVYRRALFGYILEGNEAFKSEDYNTAGEQYDAAAKELSLTDPKDAELKVSGFLNGKKAGLLEIEEELRQQEQREKEEQETAAKNQAAYNSVNAHLINGKEYETAELYMDALSVYEKAYVEAKVLADETMRAEMLQKSLESIAAVKTLLDEQAKAQEEEAAAKEEEALVSKSDYIYGLIAVGEEYELNEVYDEALRLYEAADVLVKEITEPQLRTELGMVTVEHIAAVKLLMKEAGLIVPQEAGADALQGVGADALLEARSGAPQEAKSAVPQEARSDAPQETATPAERAAKLDRIDELMELAAEAKAEADLELALESYREIAELYDELGEEHTEIQEEITDLEGQLGPGAAILSAGA